jgi:hypothetical protein
MPNTANSTIINGLKLYLIHLKVASRIASERSGMSR